MPRIGLNPHIYLRDDHPENIYRAIDEIALIGYDGLEFSGWYGQRWLERPAELQRLLKLHGLSLSTYYLGLRFLGDEVRAKADEESACLRADFIAAAGASDFLIDGGHPAIDPADPRWDGAIGIIADTCNRIGAYAQHAGVQLAWHQHWGSFFEQEAALHRFFERTDPDLVKFCPDTAQLRLSGMDEVEIIERYKHRISYVHFKDIAPNWTGEIRKHSRLAAPADEGGYGIDSRWRMVEPGRGVVDFPACWRILQSVDYDGWVVDDHDFTGYPAAQCSQAILDYFTQELGIRERRGRNQHV